MHGRAPRRRSGDRVARLRACNLADGALGARRAQGARPHRASHPAASRRKDPQAHAGRSPTLTARGRRRRLQFARATSTRGRGPLRELQLRRDRVAHRGRQRRPQRQRRRWTASDVA